MVSSPQPLTLPLTRHFPHFHHMLRTLQLFAFPSLPSSPLLLTPLPPSPPHSLPPLSSSLLCLTQLHKRSCDLLIFSHKFCVCLVPLLGTFVVPFLCLFQACISYVGSDNNNNCNNSSSSSSNNSSNNNSNNSNSSSSNSISSYSSLRSQQILYLVD
ncbi:hypothetical protein FHG87_007914 [Trinorchestia longiramus]|nr:hypothetical protein FHG87_007914 [Trinorchestia longiramus]